MKCGRTLANGAEPHQLTFKLRTTCTWQHTRICDPYIYVRSAGIIPSCVTGQGWLVYRYPLAIDTYFHPNVYILVIGKNEILMAKAAVADRINSVYFIT